MSWHAVFQDFNAEIPVPATLYTVRARLRWFGLERYWVNDEFLGWGWTLRQTPHRRFRTRSNHTVEFRYHRDERTTQWSEPAACELRWDDKVLAADIFAADRDRFFRSLRELEERTERDLANDDDEDTDDGWLATALSILLGFFGPR